MLAGFKKFIVQGNAVDLAVGVVIGAAFKAVVDALVAGVINPMIGAIFGKPNLDNLITLTIREGQADQADIKFGVVLTQAINFILVAAAVYFLIVMPINALNERRKQGQDAEAAEPTNEEKMVALLEQIASK